MSEIAGPGSITLPTTMACPRRNCRKTVTPFHVTRHVGSGDDGSPAKKITKISVLEKRNPENESGFRRRSPAGITRRVFQAHQRMTPPMQSNSSPPAPTHQYELAIDHAPPKVRRYGLRDAHSRPLVSHGKRGGGFGPSFRVSPRDSWDFPSLELRAANSWPVIILDCDGLKGTQRLAAAYIRGWIPWPNWLVTRQLSGGSHGVWTLATPVHRGANARQAPLRKLARVVEYMSELVQADRGYGAVLCHNPMSKGHGRGMRTTWGRRDPYDLGELAEIIPLGWRKPKVPISSIGRNCAIFESLMQWAGRPANAQIAVLAAAHLQNERYRDHPLGPLDLGRARGDRQIGRRLPSPVGGPWLASARVDRAPGGTGA